MSLRKRPTVLIAILAACVLLLASFLTLHLIYSDERNSTRSHLSANIEGMVRLLDLYEADHLSRVRSIVDNHTLQTLAVPLLSDKSTPDPKLLQALDAWIGPVYKSRGFVGYNLIRLDKTIVASTSRNLVGVKLQSPESREATMRSLSSGAAMSRPTLASYPIHTDGVVKPRGTIFQLACGTIKHNSIEMGFLCLRLEPNIGLFEILAASRSGETGEAYLVDRDGRILSPSRFEADFIGKQPAGSSTMRLWARVPVSGFKSQKRMPIMSDQPGIVPPQALTQMAANLIQQGEVSFLENYLDYRGRPVLGGGRWLPNTDMGLIIEEDMDEAYRSYFFTRIVIIGLTSIAAILIIVLTLYQSRNRRVLASTEQRLRAFIDNIPAGIHIKARDGRYLVVNQVYEERLGLSPGQSVGKTDFELFPVPLARKRSNEHATVLQSETTVTAVQTINDKTGTPRTYRVLRFPIYEPDSTEIAAVGSVGLDISELIETQGELQKLTQNLEKQVADRTHELTLARDAAEHATQAKADFLANMSHEIRTPLNAIVGMSYLATRLNLDVRVKRYLERIQSSGKHLLSIVNDILDFSKIEAGKLPIEQDSFSLEHMLEHVAGLVWEQADAKGLELIVHIEPGIPDQLMGDPLRIGQILINFSNNAIKFTEQGEVVIRVRLLEKHVLSCDLRFEVADTGIGIATEKLGQLFQPFQQLDSSMSRKFGGTGLGLAISRNLAALMGGRVNVSSTLGQGSVFSLDMNLTRARIGHSPIPPALGLNGQRALVVDDNAHARESLAGQLTSLSVLVMQADSGQAAMDMVAASDAEDEPYQIVFIDWKMPGFSGVETAAQIRLLSLKHPVPRLVLMAPSHEQQSVSKYVDGVVAKPLSPSLVFDTMVTLFDQKLDAREHDPQAIDQNWGLLNGRQVLLVEDNEINQEVARDLLEIVGIEVVIANDGMEAIQKVNMHTFDLVLMDVHMPIMSGLDACAAIRKDGRFDDLPIIAMTANAMEGDRERCMQVGMNDYIPKPINPEQMFATLARNLKARAELNGGEVMLIPVNPPAPSMNVAGAADHRFLDALRQKKNLSADIGLGHMMGRVDLYTKLIKRVMNERHNLLVEIKTALDQGDLSNTIRHVHGLKAISGSIGAQILQQSCVQLERELHANVVDKGSIDNVAQGFESLMKDLTDAYADADAGTVDI